MSEYINGTTDILGGSVIRYALNTTTPNQAVIRKIIAGNGISISSTGVDPGTGDVTISIDTSGTGGSGGGTGGTPTAVGTVTSINMTVPEGMFVLGAPITTAGTIALRLSSGYVIPLFVDVQQGKTAYTWGNHALAGYLLAEVDTLDSVTDRGAVTTNSLTVGNLTATSYVIANTFWAYAAYKNNNNGYMGMFFSGQDIIFNTGQTSLNDTLHLYGATQNVGIGAASDEGFRLNVNGTVKIQGDITLTSAKNLITTNQFYGQTTNFANSIFVGWDASAVYLGYSMGSTPIHLGANGSGEVRFRNTGGIKVDSFIGTGTRIVVVDSSGVLSTQATITDTDTLDIVTTRGATTTNYITVGGITAGSTSIAGYHTFYSSTVQDGSTVTVAAENASANASRSQIMISDLSGGAGKRFGIGVYTGAIPYSYLDAATKLVFQQSGGNVIVGGIVDGGYKFDVVGTGRIQDSLNVGHTSASIATIDVRNFTKNTTLYVDNTRSTGTNYASIFQASGLATNIAGYFNATYGTTNIAIRADYGDVELNRSSGTTKVGSLSGTGDRFVIADATGVLATATIGSGLSYSGGVLSATGGAAGTVTGSGTAGKIVKFNSSSDIGNSIMTESSSLITVSGSVNATSFVKSGGTSSQFLMADGSVTTSTFLTSGSFVSDYDSAITGLRNSSNKVYTLTQNFQTGTTKVYVNGVRYSPGAGNDYVETGTNQITFTNAPDSGDLILVDYIKL